MKSATLPSFWATYKSLDIQTRQRVRKTYYLWRDNPFHPSLHFKCINREENIWSVRISLNCRALGIFEKDTVT
jgi:hypothetical protein